MHRRNGRQRRTTTTTTQVHVERNNVQPGINNVTEMQHVTKPTRGTQRPAGTRKQQQRNPQPEGNVVSNPGANATEPTNEGNPQQQRNGQ